MILTLRTDKPIAEIGLFDNRGSEVVYEKWQAHRQFSSTILIKIEEVLAVQNMSSEEVTGLVFYKGPGSFTGLRIGASTANAFAYALNIPSVGENGENWVNDGLNRLKNGHTEMIIPEYGAEPHITEQKK